MTAYRSNIGQTTEAAEEIPPIDRGAYLQAAERVVRETVPIRPAMRQERVAEPRRRMLPWLSRAELGPAARIVFGVIWAIDAYFKWQPSFLSGLRDVVSGGAKGQPDFLKPWFDFAQGIVAVQPTVWAYGIALAETVIALALLLGFARRTFYIGGAIYSLLIWATAEGLGRMDGVATDIGTAIAYAVVFLALLAADQRALTRPRSVDAILERRLPWWRSVAEVRK